MSKPDDKMKRQKPNWSDNPDKDFDRKKTRDKRKSRERKRDVQ